jgi:hypothetical protein
MMKNWKSINMDKTTPPALDSTTDSPRFSALLHTANANDKNMTEAEISIKLYDDKNIESFYYGNWWVLLGTVCNAFALSWLSGRDWWIDEDIAKVQEVKGSSDQMTKLPLKFALKYPRLT